ncbi:MAG: 3-dehydroquinate synthase [Flavobacteriales bacterium]|nr:3-dehydroquinate synthase [Flavobacteriales bacterium]
MIIKSIGHSIYIGKDAKKHLQEALFSPKNRNRQKFVLADENTLRLCWPMLAASIPKFDSIRVIETKSGEENKNIEVTANIWRILTDLEAMRGSILINLGGGVITDLGGFAASTFKRGIEFINIPTTLLGQVDASFGGKTGIDLNLYKNQVGTFSWPSGVFIFPEFLNTLSRRHILAGYAEMIKHALISESGYWEKIKANKLDNLDRLINSIPASIRIKNKFILDDPEESDQRKCLNFGHTIGHALETYSLEGREGSLLHGEAVALGMIAETYISYKKRFIKKDLLMEISNYIRPLYKFPKFDNVEYHRVIQIMKNDKKLRGKGMSMTLLKGIGQPRIDINVSSDQITSALDFLFKEDLKSKSK